MKWKIEFWVFAICLVTWGLISFFVGAAVEKFNRPHSIRVSQASIAEISMACQGSYRDLAVNRRFVYANCIRRGPRLNLPGIYDYLEPITVQNYGMKQ